VVVAAKLDRIGRNAGHIHALMSYLQERGKSLACANDPIDIGSPMGRMIVYIMSTVAEMELETISGRNA
jgi:DNA invertase Pin-like site-specific DNA recombinase